ncbi:MAG: nucleotidyltransferase [Bacilli bacterium]|nr:nucleotidyltransferase [Bacilli bacterium]
MKIGIIAEFNPLHNGHLYLINKIKEKYEDASIILVLSGNYTQRGIPSIIDKWKKTELSLKLGIDLVVELPFPFSTQSADYFAYGATTILNYLKVDKLIFGSESNDIKVLEKIVDAQKDDKFNTLVKLYCKSGYNYPTALSLSLEELTNEKITTPNDLLGISYIKAIKENNYDIEVETIKRTNDYHEEELEEDISSATSIRKALKEGKDISNQVPKIELDYLNELHYIDDYFNIIKYKIITENDLSIYQTVDKEIIKKLKKEILNSNNIDEYIKRIKTKRYTYNKISRMLLHILTNFTKDKAKKYNKISYIRVLGINNIGRNILNSIKKDIEIPIISKITKEKDPMLEYELEVDKIYYLNSTYTNDNLIYYKEDKND